MTCTLQKSGANVRFGSRLRKKLKITLAPQNVFLWLRPIMELAFKPMRVVGDLRNELNWVTSQTELCIARQDLFGYSEHGVSKQRYYLSSISSRDRVEFVDRWRDQRWTSGSASPGTNASSGQGARLSCCSFAWRRFCITWKRSAIWRACGAPRTVPWA